MFLGSVYPGVVGLKHIGVPRFALHFLNTEIIKTGGAGEQVPLAKQGGFVSCLLQKFGEGLLAAIEALVEVRNPIAVEYFPVRRPPWQESERVGSQGMFEAHPFLGDPVEGRGLDIFVSITAQGLLGMIIGKDQ